MVTQNPEVRKHARTPHVKSDRTLRRQNKALRDLQAQGFQSLPDFFQKKAKKVEEQDKFEAMVARVKAKLQALQDAEEEEEPGTETENKTNTNTEPETETKEIVWIAESSGDTHQIKQEHTDSALSNTNLDTGREPSQSIFEEEEEDIDDNRALDERNGTKNKCSTEGQCNPKDAQDTVLWMLKDLHHWNDPNDCSHLQPADSALVILQDHVVLLTAQEELRDMAKEKTRGNFTHSHILAMEAILNVFLDEDLQFTWKMALVIVGKSQGCGTMRAQTIQVWVINFVHTQDLPLHQMSWKHATVLGDEELSQAIQFALVEKAKKGHLNATVLIDVISSPEMQL